MASKSEVVATRLWLLAILRFPAIYSFGDSNSDTGAAFRVKGETFFHKPVGNIVPQEVYEQGARTSGSTTRVKSGAYLVTSIFYNPKTSVLDRIGCAQNHNSVARKFNCRLNQSLGQLTVERPQVSFPHFDKHTAKYELFSHAKKLGCFVEGLSKVTI